MTRQWKSIDQYASTIDGIAAYALDCWRACQEIQHTDLADQGEVAGKMNMASAVYYLATGLRPEDVTRKELEP